MNLKNSKSAFETVKETLCSLGNAYVLCTQHLPLFLRIIQGFYLLVFSSFSTERTLPIIEMIMYVSNIVLSWNFSLGTFLLTPQT